MAKKIKIGDIIEIPTAKGFAYAQFTHAHARYGALLRVLPGFFKSKPSEFSEFIQKQEIFVTFFPLQAAVNRGIFKVVTNCPVPDFANSFPLFKTGLPDPVTNKVKDWWLWDGEKEWKIGELKPEQISLPIRGVWNDTLLIERIESGWTANTEVI